MKTSIKKIIRKHPKKLIVTGVILTVFIFCLPEPLFRDPVSTVLLDRNGQLLGARIAADGQWRFPLSENVPDKFKKAIVTFEDKRFYSHLGVDPLATLRALWLNISRGEVVSGGSTLSMQVIRLARKGKDRTILEKIREMFLATRLEFRYSKNEILALYASHAPFGGNVVGLDAAAWKYFGREADKLSWAEMSTLAVLPNAPGLIHPGKNRDILFRKRNFLLEKLKDEGMIDSTTLELARLEKLPGRPLPLPSYAPHLLENLHQANLRQRNTNAITKSTILASTQARANEVVRRHYTHLSQNGIHNAGVLILEVETGDVMAYVGNTPCNEGENGCAVDLIPAHRSSGSILKPLLYASMLETGEILPDMLVPDVPSNYRGFSPTNYDRTYKGAVPASLALARSLNIPAVQMLEQYGVARFHAKLTQLGMTSLFRPASDYGLTLILGGAESRLWDLAGIYASMARSLSLYTHYNGRYDPLCFRPPNYLLEQSRGRLDYEDFDQLTDQVELNAASVWHTFDAMVKVTRPNVESYWENFSSSRKIAWKTGTSYGYRDAWAIGCTPEYVVAVWVGNADGEGRPGLVGAYAAAPVLFDIFDLLNIHSSWFDQPYDEMRQISMCRQSGHKAGEYCMEKDTVWIPKNGQKILPCPYHRLIFLDPHSNFRVHSDCESPLDMRQESFFVLPPSQEVYYRNFHPDYKILPPFRDDCKAEIQSNDHRRNMEIIYPESNSRIFIPTDLDGKKSKVVFEVAHRDPQAIIFWHLGDRYIGQTSQIHELGLTLNPGIYELILVDEQGETAKRTFEILTKGEKP